MKTKQGFTLVELVVTLVVGLLLLSVGIPVLSTLIANNRAAADSNALVTAFQLARSEAVKRGVQVAVCAGDGTHDDPTEEDPTPTTPRTCSGTNDWAKGLVVYVPSEDNEILRVWEVLRGDSDEEEKDKVDVSEITSNLTEVAFAPDGRSVGGVACLFLDRTAAIGAVVRRTQRWLAIDATGRTRVSGVLTELQPPCP